MKRIPDQRQSQGPPNGYSHPLFFSCSGLHHRGERAVDDTMIASTMIQGAFLRAHYRRTETSGRRIRMQPRVRCPFFQHDGGEHKRPAVGASNVLVGQPCMQRNSGPLIANAPKKARKSQYSTARSPTGLRRHSGERPLSPIVERSGPRDCTIDIRRDQNREAGQIVV